MEVLVTGATGFLGQHVVQALAERGHTVSALVRPAAAATLTERLRETASGDSVGSPFDDSLLIRIGALEDERSLHSAMRGVDAVVHCAAYRAGRRHDTDEERRVNVEGTAALLRAVRRRKVGRLVHVSSLAAVGFRREAVPVDESEPWRGRDGPRVSHAQTKREAEERVLVAASYGLPAIVLNPGWLVGRSPSGSLRLGPWGRFDPSLGRRAVPGGASLVAVEDAARTCALALEHGRNGQRYIVGGTNISWRDWAAALQPHSQPRGTWPVSLGPLAATWASALEACSPSSGVAAARGWRTFGWYAFADSSRAIDELGHVAAGCSVEELAGRSASMNQGAREHLD